MNPMKTAPKDGRAIAIFASRVSGPLPIVWFNKCTWFTTKDKWYADIDGDLKPIPNSYNLIGWANSTQSFPDNSTPPGDTSMKMRLVDTTGGPFLVGLKSGSDAVMFGETQMTHPTFEAAKAFAERSAAMSDPKSTYIIFKAVAKTVRHPSPVVTEPL
jgi:hypothetical protein